MIPFVDSWSGGPVNYHLAGLPPPSLAQPRTVRLHFATLTSVLDLDISIFLPEILSLTQGNSVVWVVGTERGKKEAEGVVSKLEPEMRNEFSVQLEV